MGFPTRARRRRRGAWPLLPLVASILATGGCVEGQPRQWGYPHLLGRKAEAKPSKDTKPPKVILGAEPDPQPDPVAAGRDEAAR